jgi:hypothetical protein
MNIFLFFASYNVGSKYLQNFKHPGLFQYHTGRQTQNNIKNWESEFIKLLTNMQVEKSFGEYFQYNESVMYCKKSADTN